MKQRYSLPQQVRHNNSGLMYARFSIQFICGCKCWFDQICYHIVDVHSVLKVCLYALVFSTLGCMRNHCSVTLLQGNVPYIRNYHWMGISQNVCIKIVFQYLLNCYNSINLYLYTHTGCSTLTQKKQQEV